jgi:hypothetical protein
MSGELTKTLNKLLDGQYEHGGWPWFPDMKESPFITTHIVAGFGHLDRLGINNIRLNNKLFNTIKLAIGYLDYEVKQYYDYLIKNNIALSIDNLNYSIIYYLYARSFFNDIPISKPADSAFTYWKYQAKTFWLSQNKYMQGMIALAMKRYDDNETAVKIVKSIKENAVYNDESGMYFKGEYGWCWWQAPIETQALLIEAFDEILYDHESVELMKLWLLKQKHTQDWGTTIATAEACYSLLMRGTDLLSEDTPPLINIGDKVVNPANDPDIHTEAGTGYFKTSWGGNSINKSMADITVTNNNSTSTWGALYWQYFENLDKITPSETPLQVQRKLYIEKVTPAGPKLFEITDTTRLIPGDLVKVRIILKADTDMEFIHMKDMRAAGFEPINVLSQYNWKDGLGYYESTRDAATNFFFDYLRKGTYVFEYPLRAVHKGEFSNGITTVQSMYAPEFSSHSEGIRVRIE